MAGIALALAPLDHSGATPRSVAAATPTTPATATATPTAATTPAPCSNGTVVANPSANTGLVADCTALLEAKAALIGEGTATLNWSESLAIASWDGVSLTESGTSRVRSVHVSNKGLAGTLPAALGRLDRLDNLNLSHNSLTGPIPEELGNLTRLGILHLSGNRLSGEIPDLSGATGLQVLVIRRNRLSGEIPAWLGGMTHLRRLILIGNQLKGNVPPELGKLTGLDELRLSGNTGVNDGGGTGLTGCIPPPLKNVKNNDIASLGLPDCACWNGTVVASPSASLGLVADCAALLEAKAALIGEGAATLNWSESLAIASWEGVSLTESGASRVRSVHVSNKSLAGTLPAALGRLDRLDNLNLSHNQLDGTIPAELGNLTRLGILHLSGNRLSGEIPDLSGATGLQVLVIRRNRLSGEIPAWLGGMTHLRRLILIGNQLKGNVPPELGKLTGLDELRLSGNTGVNDGGGTGLTGCIPPPLKNVKNNDIASLGLPDCACWNGTVVASPSASLGLVADCAALLEAKAALIGEGAATLNWSESLAIASWEGVSLTESGASRVRSVHVSNKSLAGTLPAALGRLDRLDNLNLSHNQLDGTIPAELGNLTRLGILHLSGNQLTGEIPDLRGAAGLQVLVVRRNRLSGEIPAWLGEMTRLRRLILIGNQLKGDVPPELGKLTGLDDLMLSGNTGVNDGGGAGLTGCIPPPLKNVKNNDIASLSLPDCACWNGTVVANPSGKLGLVADCATLLQVKTALIGEGTATLNWSESLAIASWESVGFEDGRVSSISLSGKRLAGSIPAALGRLDGLKYLNLARNSLTGPIPADLDDPPLKFLYLSDNSGLTGCIPSALQDDVATNDLDDLNLPDCVAPEGAAATPAPSG